MYNKFHFTFHLRTDGIADKGFPFIYAKVMLTGTRVNLGSMGIRVTKENWDTRSRRLKSSDVTSIAHNAKLDTLESQVRSVVLYAESRQERVTLSNSRELFVQPQPVSLTSSR
ncbi:hypothetical protein [Siphonobacter curvatus]|uniref:Arm DNA-binding domain-containing protein n=1 Tax=Siphonobacter curvatus TaxID=2094562 RepID=A0A2S7IEC1_9BACT|nr:hypothetical protein [Siphonobacter curvatus]PQA52992.1 hypothetical protein C5O19_25215 [Siphonobacter curvatus]